jgi:hypothetical protein
MRDMGGRQFVVIAKGRRHVLGWTDSYSGIWKRRLRRWRLVAQYPLGDEGLQAAQQRFASLEPAAVYVNLKTGTPLTEQTGSRLVGIGLAVLVVGAVGAVATFGVRWSSGGSHAGASPTTSTTVIATPPPGGGWASSSTSEVDYMQWTSNAGSLQGTITKVEVAGDPPNQRSSKSSQPLTGSRDDKQVSLSIDGAPVVYGSLSRLGLTVNWPASDGTVTEQVFEPVSAGGYDQAVQSLVQQAVGSNASGAPVSCSDQVCLPVPPVPSGYEEIGRIASQNGSAHAQVRFSSRRVQMCFAVSDPAVSRLTFRIGSPLFGFGGSTTMFDSSGGNSVTNGCHSDPGNDGGSQNVSIHADGQGSYVVAIYQELS